MNNCNPTLGDANYAILPGGNASQVVMLADDATYVTIPVQLPYQVDGTTTSTTSTTHIQLPAALAA